MAVGNYYTIVIWEIRPGYNGKDLEDITKEAIIPQYSQIPGVISVKLFKINEGEDANKYMAVTEYETREAFINWWNQSEQKLLEWQKKYRGVLERWVDVASPIRKHNMTLMVEAEFPGK